METLLQLRYDEAQARLRAKVKAWVPNLDEDLPFILVTHRHPDTDAYACLWKAVRFIVGDSEYKVVLLPAGVPLPDEDRVGHRVLEMDTGGGPLDQHGKGLTDTSSFKLMCEHYGFHTDEGLWPFIKLTVATDRAEQVDRLSLHYQLRGLANYHRDHTSNEIDWGTCCQRAFEMFDILYNQETSRLQSAVNLHKLSKRYTLENGMNVCLLWGNPQLRDAAFEDGADVVMWTILKRKHFQVGIALNRNAPNAVEKGMLSVVSAIRIAEAKARGIDAAGHDLRATGPNKYFGGWYAHPGENGGTRLILCGSKKAPLEPEERTKLSWDQLCAIVNGRLGNDNLW
ncbi:MAG: hypothetical protein WCK46_00760 [Candidatus Adlerbacteria bacterium]